MKIVKVIKRFIIYVFVSITYFWGCIWYDKRYLKGRYFERKAFTKGWEWIWKYWFTQKVLRMNGHIPFPVPPYVTITTAEKIFFDLNDMNNFHTVGSYFQCINGTITIGTGSCIAPGVGIITTNHDIKNIEHSAEGKDIIIGKNCWIGMNAVILPGVILGDRTVVGAGAIVTKPFPEGNCVLVGNPARKIKEL